MPIKSLTSFSKLAGGSITGRSYTTAATFNPALLSTMTSPSPVKTREEFLASATSRLLAGPVLSFGYHTPEKQKQISSPAFVLQQQPADEEPVIVSNNVLVPLSKSLRHRLVRTRDFFTYGCVTCVKQANGNLTELLRVYYFALLHL
jgi:hypothetical protein